MQSGYLLTYCWTLPEPDGRACGDSVPGFPNVDRVKAGGKLYARIFEPRRPESFHVVFYARVAENLVPLGRARRSPVDLRPVVWNGMPVAWDAIFEVARPERHYYLEGEGRRYDLQFEENTQDAAWSSHVNTAG